MEISTAAFTIGTILAVKALEETGKKIGETLCAKISSFYSLLKADSPDTVKTIEGVSSPSPELLKKVVIEVERIAENNPALREAINEVLVEAKKCSDPEISEISKASNYTKLAENIGAVALHAPVYIGTQNFS